MKFTKKIAALLIALMVATFAAACNKDTSSASSSAPESSSVSSEVVSSEAVSSEAPSSEAAPVGEQMTEEAYKAKVLELFNSVSTAATTEMSAVDQTDAEAVLAATTKIFEVTSAAYNEMANLNAPDSFAEAQANFKIGVPAALSTMELSLEMIELASTEMTEDEMNKLGTEFQAKLTALTADVQKLNDGLVAVLGAEVVSAAAATLNAG